MSKEFTLEDQRRLQEILMHRRDVRGNRFLPTPIPSDAINTILQAATLGPSVGFSQPWEFVIVESKATRQKIVESFQVENDKAKATFSEDKQALYSQLKLEGILESPINIAVFYTPSTEPVLGQNTMAESGEYSVACAIQNMWLMARALNIGMGWVSIINPDTVKTILNAPPKHKLIGYLCLGYVKAFLDQPELETLQWEERKSMESVVFYDTY